MDCPPSPSSVDFLDDLASRYTAADVTRLWLDVPHDAPHRTLGSTLLTWAINNNLIEFPEEQLLGNVQTILGITGSDPWSWVLAELNTPLNSIHILNAANDVMEFPASPRTLSELVTLFQPLDLEHTAASITARLRIPRPSLLPRHVQVPTDASLDILQHIRIANAGTVRGPMPGGAPLCTVAETQLCGHRLVFEWPRTPNLHRAPLAFTVDNIINTLSNIDLLEVYLVAPGMAIDSDDDITRLVVNLEISVHLGQAWHRLAGARP
ncbi:hypothetical protein OC842_007248 [Tilletia horrida]|uniref:Uncharacterized protein n=1 Tax=Tilletia horrida TaxID=155126 RepID=A0AAN6JMM4_9BASI|nr:hypothetical protein OC842_007248 [Tilletia horrida]